MLARMKATVSWTQCRAMFICEALSTLLVSDLTWRLESENDRSGTAGVWRNSVVKRQGGLKCLGRTGAAITSPSSRRQPLIHPVTETSRLGKMATRPLISPTSPGGMGPKSPVAIRTSINNDADVNADGGDGLEPLRLKRQAIGRTGVTTLFLGNIAILAVCGYLVGLWYNASLDSDQTTEGGKLLPDPVWVPSELDFLLL